MVQEQDSMPAGYRLISVGDIDQIRAAILSVNNVLADQEKKILIQENRLIRLEENQRAQQQQQSEVLKQLIKVDNSIEQINAALKEQKIEERERIKENRASMNNLRNTIIGVSLAALLGFLYTQIFPRIEYNHSPQIQQN